MTPSGKLWRHSSRVFSLSQRAYSYVRVLEISTPRWVLYDEEFYDPLDLPDDAVMVQQDRAYTSPIW